MAGAGTFKEYLRFSKPWFKLRSFVTNSQRNLSLIKARKGQAKEALMPDATPKLPHHSDDIFLTDGGTETWLMYKRGFDLPEFSAFHLLND